MRLSWLIIVLASWSTVLFGAEVKGITTAEDVARELLSRYAAPEDSLRRLAAEYLLEGLPMQWHYDVDKLEETGAKVKVMDSEVVDADYLAENIEYAFKAWELPWARVDISLRPSIVDIISRRCDDSSGLNVPPVSLSNVPGIAESIVPPIAETNVPGVSL